MCVTDMDSVVLDRINFGYIPINDKYINYLANCENKNRGLHIGLFSVIRNYFGGPARSYLGESLVEEILKLESDASIKTPAQMVTKITQLGKKWVIKCVPDKFEEIFLQELLHETGRSTNSKRFLFWLLFGANGDDILDNKLCDKELFDYFRAMMPVSHGLETEDDGPMGNFVACRIAAWIIYTFISYFGKCEKDNIDHITTVLIKTKVDGGSSAGLSGAKRRVSHGDVDSDIGIKNNIRIRTGFDLIKLYQCQSKIWHEKVVLFNTSLIHSSVAHLLWGGPFVDESGNSCKMTQDTMIWFIKYFYEKLCQISSVYYKILHPRARTTYRTLDTKGSKLRQIANEYNNKSLLQFGTNRSGNLLHYAISHHDTHFKLINFLIIDCQFDTDLKVVVKDNNSPNGKSELSPLDLVNTIEDDNLKQRFKENNVLIPPTYRKTTANELYEKWLSHEGKLRRALEVQTKDDVCQQLDNILKNLKEFEAIDEYELCLVYRLLLNTNDKKHNDLARKLVFSYIDALDQYINGDSENMLKQHRIKQYLMQNFFLFENVTQILTGDEVSKVKTFMSKKLNEADIGILETVRSRDLEDEKKQDDTTNKKPTVKHKKTNSDKLMALTRLVVYDLTCFTLSQSESQRKGKEKLFSIKQECQKSPQFDDLTTIEFTNTHTDDQLRQDASPFGVQWDYVGKEWYRWYNENTTNVNKLTFDPIDHYDDKHVKDLIARAHFVNRPFQQQLQMLVQQHMPGAKYLPAPVKTEARVSEKSQTDYRNKRYPK